MARRRSSYAGISRSLARVLSLAVFAGLLTGCLERRDHDTSRSRDSCTECHGGKLEAPFQAAPPFNLAGETTSDARGNGAHAAHLFAGERARPLACTECHRVPEEVDDVGHIDTPYPAEVAMNGPAGAFDALPYFDAGSGSCKETFCHGASFVGSRPSGGTIPEPVWTSTPGQASACGACHGLPPPLPHPETNDCSECHKNVAPDRTFPRPDLHVNGIVNFYIPDDD